MKKQTGVNCYIDGDDLIISLPSGHKRLFARIESPHNPFIEAVRYIFERHYEIGGRIQLPLKGSTRDMPGTYESHAFFNRMAGVILRNATSTTKRNIPWHPEKYNPTSETIHPSNVDILEFCLKKCINNPLEKHHNCCKGHVPPNLETFNDYCKHYQIEQVPIKDRQSSCPYGGKTGCVIPRKHRPYLCTGYMCMNARRFYNEREAKRCLVTQT